MPLRSKSVKKSDACLANIEPDFKVAVIEFRRNPCPSFWQVKDGVEVRWSRTKHPFRRRLFKRMPFSRDAERMGSYLTEKSGIWIDGKRGACNIL